MIGCLLLPLSLLLLLLRFACCRCIIACTIFAAGEKKPQRC